MKYGAAALLIVLAATLPAPALADAPTLQLSQQATVGGASVPVDATVSTQEDVVLTASKTDGAVPVTFTLYVAPKPKPKPAPAPSNQVAAVESSAGIQQGIGTLSPTTEQYVQPVFSTIDSARSGAADVLDSQLASTKDRLAPDLPGQVLGAEATKNAASNPMGAFGYLLNTLYFYLLTLLRFMVGSAGVFYPLFAIAFLWALWRSFRIFRRRAY